VDELEREVGVPFAVYDGLKRLQAAGLIHRLKDDRFVFLSRAADRAVELEAQL
jgi:Fe2+ or Zn2+ uptake regulation protein